MTDTALTGQVHSLETFGLVDGPGVRCVVFLQGCKMRCRYCHNPETWSQQGGETWTAEDLFRKVYRYRNYWGKDGGLTVSGGEPVSYTHLVPRLLISMWSRARAVVTICTFNV